MQLKPLYLSAALLASITFPTAQAQTADWDTHSLSGTVAARSGNEITADLPGYAKANIIITAQTKFRRYTPDSVTLAQATPSSIAKISTGDQIRAFGEKSADGSTITADQVVFGTFGTRGGTITAIDPQSSEITIQEVGTHKPFVVKLAADSKLKMLPSMHEPEQDHGGSTPSAPVDIAQMLGHMPDGKIGDLRVGSAVLVSSPKAAANEKSTAILVLANAGMFVDLMQQQAEGNGAGMEHLLMSHGWNPAKGLNLPAILQ